MYAYADKKGKIQKQSRLVQRKYDFLESKTLSAGTVLYHGTRPESKASFEEKGIDFDLCRESHSQLGCGFYTSTDENTAKESIRSNEGLLLKIHTTKEMEGQCADRLTTGEYLSPNALKEIMDARTEISMDEIGRIAERYKEDERPWTSIQEDGVLNEGNDFIRTEEHKVPFGDTRIPTWLSQYKFNPSAKDKLEIIKYVNLKKNKKKEWVEEGDPEPGCCGWCCW